MMWHHVQDIVVDGDVDDATRMACTEALTFLSVCPEGQQSILEHHVIAALTSACRVSGPKSRTLYVCVVCVCVAWWCAPAELLLAPALLTYWFDPQVLERSAALQPHHRRQPPPGVAEAADTVGAGGCVPEL